MCDVCVTPVLRYYDVQTPVSLTCSASQHGHGSAWGLQDGSPMAHASLTLTETEKRYAQIEKELLAVAFACFKFYDYIYGKPVTVKTDHQPLVSILKRPFHTVPARSQHMMLKLHKFNLTLVLAIPFLRRNYSWQTCCYALQGVTQLNTSRNQRLLGDDCEVHPSSCQDELCTHTMEYSV